MPRKSPASAKKTTKSATAKSTPKKEDAVVTSTDKEELLASLKQTMHDLGRLPGLIMAPVLTFVSSQYEKIPQERRDMLTQILSDIKEEGTSGLGKLKDRFTESITSSKNKPEEKKTTTTPRKKTTSRTKKTTTSSTKKSTTRKRKPASTNSAPAKKK